MAELSEIDWDDIIDTLGEEKCVLFLGSGVFEIPGYPNMEEAFKEKLKVGDPNHPYIHLYSPDGFLVLRKKRFKRKVISEMKSFYDDIYSSSEDFFHKLAKIPFSIVVSLTPDNILTRTYDALGLDYQSDFYLPLQTEADYIEKPTKEKPLIYNLLGNIEDPDSIILTHEDFFDYLSSIFRNTNLNQSLSDELGNMERFIFLGLPYEKWYFQLLLRILSINSTRLQEVERLALQEFQNPTLNKLYTNEFKIEFFPIDIVDFIDQLYRECEHRKVLKQSLEPSASEQEAAHITPENIEELVANAKTVQALRNLRLLATQLKGIRVQEIRKEIILLQNNYNILQQRELHGTIYPADYSVENARITERLLEILKTIRGL